MISVDTIHAILGLKEKTKLSPEEMAGSISLTFYPTANSSDYSNRVEAFSTKLENTLKEIGVNIVPYDEALEKIPVKKRLRRLFASLANDLIFIFNNIFHIKHERVFLNLKTILGILKKYRIKPGISIIVLGENQPGKMPIDVASSFRLSSVITILDKPPHISSGSSFLEHFDTAMNLFAYHMTNIVILVGEKDWILYNFNASHPTYDISNDFKKNILHGLIPKIAAPIRPYRFSDFKKTTEHFNSKDKLYVPIIKDLVECGPLFEKLDLYPPGKNFWELPFRNKFYEWIGKIHLDNRTGMSYGFLAWQLPVKPSPLIPLKEAFRRFDLKEVKNDYFVYEGEYYLIISIDSESYCIKVPEVWILSQRSGSNKTRMNPDKDLVKLGLKNGEMFLQTPVNIKLPSGYRPSFDTGVMLAHGVGNAIVASVLAHFLPKSTFLKNITVRGMALSHWHGYLDPSQIPMGLYVHGASRPNVSCSSPQSAVYALEGKLSVFKRALENKEEYLGDIHIEPHHGTNINFSTLTELVNLFIKNKGMATLGSRYLNLYN